MIRVQSRVLPLAGAVLALATFAGCAQNPQVAARVGSETITLGDLDLMSQVLCVESSSGQQAQTVPVATATNTAMSALIQSAVDRQYAAANDLSPDGEAIAQQLQRLDPLLEKVPAADRDRTRDLIADLFRGQQQVYAHAQQSVEASGGQATGEAVQQAAAAMEAEYAKTLDVTINPRFDSAGADHRGDGFGSLSRAVSSNAKAAVAPQPDPSWAASLPANQKCG